MKKNEFLLLVFCLLLISVVFRAWFSLYPLSAGDWSFKFLETIRMFHSYPYAWDMNLGSGFGGNDVFLLALNSYFLASSSLFYKYLNISWVFIERIVWFWPFLVISVFTSYYLFKKLFSNRFALLSSFIYLFNTYILMIVGGGQMGIAMAYAFIPAVVLGFFLIIENQKKNKGLVKQSIVSGLLFSIQLMFDERIAYATLLIIGIFSLFYLFTEKFKFVKNLFMYFLFIPFSITFLLNFFWIVPFFLTGQNPLNTLGDAFTGKGMVKFLSFARFENTISLLHPNWPENLFGKVYFMRPEFLLIPILAFGSLFFINSIKSLQEKKKYFIFLFLSAPWSIFCKRRK